VLLNDTIPIKGMDCQYDKLPQICKDLIPQYEDVSLKYGIIIIVGVLNIIVMSFLFWKIKQFLDAKKKQVK